MAIQPLLQQLQLLLTERCNLTCSHCAVPEETSPALHELDAAQWNTFIDRVLESGVRRIVLSGGEALLRTDCLAIAEHALMEGAEVVVIVTYGSVLPTTTSARLADLQRRWPGLLLHVSIDGAEAVSHDLIRGYGSFDRTMAGLARVRAAGGRVDGVHSVINRRNVDDFEAMADLARGLGATTWTIFPVAAIGRGVDLDDLRLGQQDWERLLHQLAISPPADLDLGIMGPTVGDEWSDVLAVPAPRAVHSPQAVIGPDGAVFTCPPLRHAIAGQVLDVIEGSPWSDVDASLRISMAEACPTCKYRSLCTGVDAGAPLLVATVPFGEPRLSVSATGAVPVSIGRRPR